jgi:hypothetical protein
MNILWITGLPGAGKSYLFRDLRGMKLNLDSYGNHDVATGWIIDTKALSRTLRSVGRRGTYLVEGVSDNNDDVANAMLKVAKVKVFVLIPTYSEWIGTMKERAVDPTYANFASDFIKRSKMTETQFIALKDDFIHSLPDIAKREIIGRKNYATQIRRHII